MKNYIIIKQERKYKKIEIRQILYCEASGAYTNIHLNNGDIILVTSLLKDIELLLKDCNFFRISRSCIVNIRQSEEIFTGRTPIVTLYSGHKIKISKSKVKSFINEFCSLVK